MRILSALVLALALGVLTGCNQDVPKEKTYTVKMPTGVARAKLLLQQYVQGAPPGSEVTEFPQIVAEARKDDPQKADVLEKGLDAIQRSKGNHAALAKDLIEKL